MTHHDSRPPPAMLRVLVLYAHYGVRASYYDDWLDALRGHSKLQVSEINISSLGARGQLKRRLPDADLVILLHSVNADQVFYLEPLASLLAERRCKLLSFVGNEVNLPGAPISEKRRVLRMVRPDWIATQLLAEAGHYLWGDIAPVVAIPHALNPAAFQRRQKLADRRIDVGLRSFRYSAVLGDLDRNRVMDWVSEAGPTAGLAVDISQQRFDRTGWAAYLNTCRATIATEAGSWYLQTDDALVDAVLRAYSSRGFVLPAKSQGLRRLVHRLPWALRERLMRWLSRGPFRYEATSLNRVSDTEILTKFFLNADKAPIYGKCISSRHFDAVGTGTAQILLAGRYNDILMPGQDYLELKDDLSNGGEVLEQLRDTDSLERMSHHVLEKVMSQHTYAHRVQQILDLLEA